MLAPPGVGMGIRPKSAPLLLKSHRGGFKISFFFVERLQFHRQSYNGAIDGEASAAMLGGRRREGERHRGE